MSDSKIAETKPIDVQKEEMLIDNLNEERVLFEWVAADRAFQKREKDFWITAVAMLILVGVIFFFIKEFFLIIALGSLLFMFYVLSTVPPTDVKYSITNRGIYFGDSHYYWDVLEKFWFKKSLSTDMVHFGTSLKFPRTISMVIKAKDQEKIKEIAIKRLPLIESPPNFIENLTEWFAKRLPLESRTDKPKSLKVEEKKS